MKGDAPPAPRSVLDIWLRGPRSWGLAGRAARQGTRASGTCTLAPCGVAAWRGRGGQGRKGQRVRDPGQVATARSVQEESLELARPAVTWGRGRRLCLPSAY